MSAPVQATRLQGQYFHGRGTGIPGGGGYLSELYAFANAAAAGDTTLVAAVTGKKIRVLSFGLSCVTTGASTATFKSGSTAISPTYSLAANGSHGESSESGLFETVAGAALVLTAGTNIVGARVTYILVD